jgi:hypothetical protein
MTDSKNRNTPFHKTAIANVEKTEKDVALERVDDFLIDARADIGTQIAGKQAQITKSKAEKEKASRTVKNVEKEFEGSKKTIASDLTQYMERWNKSLSCIDNAKENLGMVSSHLKGLE